MPPSSEEARTISHTCIFWNSPPWAHFTGCPDRKDPLTRPPAPSMLKETGWSSAKAGDLVECHATSTRQGDVEEVRALKAFFNSSNRTVITSFKSQIGHTLGASGINSLIRGVTAMKAGVFPPTLNYRHPDPEIDLEGSGLLITPEPPDWKGRPGEPRRLQVK